MDCAICLNHIPRSEEAYLYPCTHFFCFKCIEEWTDRQRQHAPNTDCPPGQGRCTFACPLCKSPYSYVCYECIGSSCRLIPTCGQPKTMSAMPLTAEQSRRRALYVTPAQFAPTKQVPVAKRPRPPQDKETVTFVQRELQAVLLTEDVEIIVQHVTGVLLNISKRHAAKPSPTSRAAGSGGTTYGDQAGLLAAVAASMAGFLGQEQAAQFAAQLWCFLHSGLTVAAYDRLVFGAAREGEQQGDQEQQDHIGSGGDAGEAEAGALQDW